jgi:hypothetical protein
MCQLAVMAAPEQHPVSTGSVICSAGISSARVSADTPAAGLSILQLDNNCDVLMAQSQACILWVYSRALGRCGLGCLRSLIWL